MMFDQLEKILAQAGDGFADIRYESVQETTIGFSGNELNTVSANTGDGFVVRILDQGGMASVTFTRSGEAEMAVKSAMENAALFARHTQKPVKMAPVPVIKDVYLPALAEDPRQVTMDEKLELVRKYNGIATAQPQVATTNIAYREVCRSRYYLNSEGSRIREDLITTAVRGNITASQGGLTQNIRVSTGGSDGFGSVRGKEDHFEKQTKLVLDLLKAEPVRSGSYSCIVNPSLAGVFAHEAFGHFSEADIVETLPAMREKMRIGAELGSGILNIIDDATQAGQLGFYRYDDEGVAVRPVPLIKSGVLSGRLHSRRTAAEFGEPVSGHCVAEDYRFAPIIRMGTIYIQPGSAGLDELMQAVGDGLYLLDAKGGETSGENFTFGANYGYEIKDGKPGRMVRDINISGNLYQTLKDIRMVGNDLILSKTGGCGKGQTNIRSCNGGPHTVIDNLIVGGI
jgi:TldD protein